MPTLEGADKAFADSVNRLIKETGVTLQSGYRSNAEQQALYNNALKKYGSEQEARKWAAKPGGSNHEHGIAADIGNFEKVTDAQLAKYGLYRPMSWEPWHIEPIGSRSKGGRDAYTTPPVDPALHKTLETFTEAIKNLDVGPAESTMGAAESTVGAVDPTVGVVTGDQTMKAPQKGTVPSSSVSTAAPATESTYAALFNAAGAKYGISPKVLQEIARAESNFNPKAGSPAGAQGLMQFMPATAKGMGVDPMDPASAIDGAARYISNSLKEFGSLELALAAYNAGGGAVKKHGGIPPYKETQNYVAKIMAKVNS